jgi:hypothetical protein
MSTGVTRPVPSSADGSYTRPDTIESRIAAKMKLMRKVDFNGRDLPPGTPDPSVVELVTPPTAPPSLAVALNAAAEAVGCDLPALLDSQSFCAELGAISPSDSLGLEDVIRRHMPAPVAPGMRPNPAQGIGGGVPVPSPPRGSTLQQLAHQLANGASPSLPEGFVPAKPR